jgi:hypothetical protein
MLVGTFGNVPFSDDDMVWHPSKEAVAFSVLENRRDNTVWIWEHKFGVHKLLHAEFLRLLQLKKGKEPFSTEATIKVGRPTNCKLRSSGGEESASTLIGWDLAKHKWRVISREKQKPSD